MAGAVDAYLKWSGPKKALVWGVLCAAIGAGYYFALFQPSLEELRGLQAQYETLGRELRENQAIADNLAQVQEEVRRLDEKLQEAKQKLPEQEEIPSLLQKVSDLGKEAGLEFLLFKPGAPVPKDFYAEVPLELQIYGSYHDLAAFFDKIGRLNRIVTIEDIDFGAPKTTPGGLKITASFRAVTFKFLEPGEQPAKPTTTGGTRR
ncbi:MAG: type 4a pilus biogenesis protein PilO [Deferrisomatales bacterium]